MRVIFFFVAVSAAFAQGRSREPVDLARSGKIKTDDRIAALTKSVADKPETLRPQIQLATAYIQKMRETVDFSYLDRASRIVEDVLSRDPGNYDALRLRSEISMERHEFQRVLEYSEEMSKFVRDDPWNWGMLGDASMELGQYQRAGEAYQKMVSLRPDLSSYNRLAWYRFVTGDPESAIAMMRQAISSGGPVPENVAWCLADLGRIYWKLGRLTDADGAFREALKIFPGYYPAHAGLGAVYAAQGKLADAIESYKKAQAAVPMPDFAAALEDLYAAAGKPDESRRQKQLLDAIEQMAKATNEKTNRNLAIIYADRDRNLPRAVELAGNEIAVRPDIYTYDALAWVLYKTKSYEKAEEASRKALALGTPEPAFYYHAGMIALALDKKADARKELEKALALNAKFDFRQAPVAVAALRGLP